MAHAALQSYQYGKLWATKERARWMIEIFYEAPFQVKRLEIVTQSFWETEKENRRKATPLVLSLFVCVCVCVCVWRDA